jgi:anthranilate phosphoribosyltransferase
MMNEIQRYISLVTEGQNLSQDDAARAFQIIMSGGATPAQMAAFLTALKLKGETIEEITGAAMCLRAKMETVTAPEGAIDVCGTGGDGKRTLNVSTAVALVVAACGVPVVKHGNKSVSSLSGSADVLTALGVNVQTAKERAEEALQDANICFMMAPLFHKAMRHVAPVRQELATRTIFNLLGPLVNPAKPRRQLMGVYDKALLVPMAKALQALGSEKAWVVHGNDGLDELTLYGVTYVAELKDGQISEFEVTPQDAGLSTPETADALQGGNATHNAHELNLLLSGKESPYRDIVLLNSAAALMVADKVTHLKAGTAKAAEAISSGKAKETLAKLMWSTNHI